MLKTINPELRAAWIERGNPVLQSPDSNCIKKAFSSLSFIVVVEQFMTDTAAFADIILPAKDIFEQSDIIGSYWSPYVQFKPKVIESPGEVMPESEIYYHLSKKLNLSIDDLLIPEPGNSNIEKWLENRIKNYSDLTVESLKKSPVLAPGLQHIAWEDLKFETPSGKIELYSIEANTRWGISPLPEYKSMRLSDEEKLYPLIFLTPNTGSRIHSQFGNLKIIKETNRDVCARISPTDALRRNIKDGQKIRIFNMKGELIISASVSNRIQQGIVMLPNGIWFSEGGGGNQLIAGEETDIGFGAAFHDNRVEIEGVV
jgi:anaerobic selenocysteine-containing dehydrogenase